VRIHETLQVEFGFNTRHCFYLPEMNNFITNGNPKIYSYFFITGDKNVFSPITMKRLNTF